MTLFMKKVNSAITRIKIETFLCYKSRNLRATWYLAWNLSVVTLVKDHSQFFKKMISHSGICCWLLLLLHSYVVDMMLCLWIFRSNPVLLNSCGPYGLFVSVLVTNDDCYYHCYNNTYQTYIVGELPINYIFTSFKWKLNVK